MNIKHKLTKDFYLLSSDKKILILKYGSILENYIYKTKNDTIKIDKDIVDANPEFFQLIDWKSELLIYLKYNKIPQPSQIYKKLIPFIEEIIISDVMIEKEKASISDIKSLEDDLIKSNLIINDIKTENLNYKKEIENLNIIINSLNNEKSNYVNNLKKNEELQEWENKLREIEFKLKQPTMPK